MAAYTATTLDGIMKRLYGGQVVKNLGLNAKARPLFTALRKNPKFAGSVYPQPIIYANGAAVGHDFSVVQSNARAASIKKFLLDVGKQYAVATIDSDSLDRASGPGAFVDAMKIFNDTAIQTLYDRVEQMLFSPIDGHLGAVGSGGISSNVFTLASKYDAVKFYPGMVIRMAADASSAPRANSATITKVNVNTGQITMDSTPTSASAGDLIFNSADYNSAAGGDEKAIHGLPDWLPSTAPSSGDSFYSVDRSADTARLAGTIYSGSTADILGSIVGACLTVGRLYGVTPDKAFMSWENFRKLLNEVDAKVERRDGVKATTVGTAEVNIIAGSGTVSVVPATHCGESDIYALRMEDWELLSMGDAVRIIKKDGLTIRAQASDDGWESRWVSRPCLACRAPGQSARITL